MKIGQYYENGQIWTVLSSKFEFEFDKQGEITCITPCYFHGEEATDEEIREAYEYYDSEVKY